MKRLLFRALPIVGCILVIYGCDVLKDWQLNTFIKAYVNPTALTVSVCNLNDYVDNSGVSDTDNLTLHVEISNDYHLDSYVDDNRETYTSGIHIRDSLGDTGLNYRYRDFIASVSGIVALHYKITSITITATKAVGGIAANEPITSLFDLYYVDAAGYITNGYNQLPDTYLATYMVYEKPYAIYLTKASADSKADYGKDYIGNVLLMQLKNPLTEPGRYTFTVKMSFANGRTVSESASVTIME